MLFYLFSKLIGKGGGRCFSLHQNIAGRLFIDRDRNLGSRQTLKEVEHHFDWVVMRIDRRRECFPIRLGTFDEVHSWRVALDESLQISDLKADNRDVEGKDDKCRQVCARGPEEPTAPFPLPLETGALLPPDLRRQVELDRLGRCFHPHMVGSMRENPLYRITQGQAVLIEKDGWERRVNAL